jgi:hypothetical protein
MRKFCETKSALGLVLTALYLATAGIFYLAATREYQPVPGFDAIRLFMLVLLFPLLVKYGLQLVCAPLYSLVCALRNQPDTAA